MSFESSEPMNQDSSCVHEDEPVYWGQTTDPIQHNPDNFRYLVHAFVNLLTYELGQRRLMSECL